MIKKEKVKEILSHQVESHQEHEEISFYESTLQSTRVESLTIIICNAERSFLYQKIKDELTDVLICEDIRYIKSVNHLDRVRYIIIDYESFSDEIEVSFLIQQFQILHQICSIILIYENLNDLYGLNKQIKNKDNVYVLHIDDLDIDYSDRRIVLSEIRLEPKRKKFWTKRKLRVTAFVLVILILAIAGVFGYLKYKNNGTSSVIHNTNMNVQLDMADVTILPINMVYSDGEGNHIVIEELSTGEDTLKMELFDNDKNKIISQNNKVKCPEAKCNYHYEMVFTPQKEIDYYILQIDSGEMVKNIEIDPLYFK